MDPRNINAVAMRRPFGPNFGLAMFEDMHGSIFDDIERKMDQMMSMALGGAFGPFGNSGFGSGTIMTRMGTGRSRELNPFQGFEAILAGFDGFDEEMLSMGGESGFSQTFVSSTRMGADGRMHTENYFNNNIRGMTEDGQRVGQMEEMYGNTETGEKKIAQQRTLNDRGAKIVKTKMGNGQEEHHSYYHGFDEDGYSEFQNRWHEQANRANFDRMVGQEPTYREQISYPDNRYGSQPVRMIAHQQPAMQHNQLPSQSFYHGSLNNSYVENNNMSSRYPQLPPARYSTVNTTQPQNYISSVRPSETINQTTPLKQTAVQINPVQAHSTQNTQISTQIKSQNITENTLPAVIALPYAEPVEPINLPANSTRASQQIGNDIIAQNISGITSYQTTNLNLPEVKQLETANITPRESTIYIPSVTGGSIRPSLQTVTNQTPRVISSSYVPGQSAYTSVPPSMHNIPMQPINNNTYTTQQVITSTTQPVQSQPSVVNHPINTTYYTNH